MGNGSSVTLTCWLAVPTAPRSSTTVRSTAYVTSMQRDGVSAKTWTIVGLADDCSGVPSPKLQ